MKTKLLLSNMAVLYTALLLTSLTYAQTIWRVNNQSNYDGTTNFGENYGGTPSFPVFSEINEAVAYPNVNDGDILHIEGSTIVYADATITKELVIIGPGYFLTENPKVSNNTYDAKIGRVTFDSGSESSQLIGMNVLHDGSNVDGIVYVNVNDISIKRCRIERYVRPNTLLIDLYILQNFFPNTYNTSAIADTGSSSYIPPQEIIFNNNICQKKLLWTDNAWGTGTIMECNNNVFDGPANELNLEFNTGSFQNNILKAAGITANINSGTNNNVQYNTVSTSGVFDGTTGNIWVPSMALLFVEEGTTDGLYQLQSGSSYNQAGSDGAERGAYGGVVEINRYNLSGLGAIPVAYDVTTTGVSEPGTGLSVTVKARTNN
ncbi:hypothetical protein BWZ22_05850 [Seonamhaeicola sp. S2-3]|uniref:hypothetical protein n=1 Tax=Seonamhaeicola sp. S2-3 TaxID=1936081 RepID=UPI0009728D23|nr:hypothetical protein [Seonamhaeicola sp. S2-3]APY10791.1 hypothetical protein BWZ22_05850 [Seonamhaeicola sp. S2-3]